MDVWGLLLELLLMVVIDGLSDAPSLQDCKWYAVPEVLMTALRRSTILGPRIYDGGSCRHGIGLVDTWRSLGGAVCGFRFNAGLVYLVDQGRCSLRWTYLFSWGLMVWY